MVTGPERAVPTLAALSPEASTNEEEAMSNTNANGQIMRLFGFNDAGRQRCLYVRR